MTGEFNKFVVLCLSKLAEFRDFQQFWGVQVSVEREQLPGGGVAQEDDSDDEYEDASPGLLQSDSAAAASSGHLVTDSALPSHSSQGSDEYASVSTASPSDFSKFTFLRGPKPRSH